MQANHWKQTLLRIGIFAIAMAFLEAAVVVYLRLQFYPEGFSFPLKTIPSNILIIEVIREVATIVMLTIVGWLAGKSFLERFAYFAFSFGVWDIFYYVFLKLTLDWPSSLFEWDILFLIPIPWVGPVLASVLVSICLIGASAIILQRQSNGRPVMIRPIQWIFILLSGLIIIVSFLSNMKEVADQLKPVQYHWWVYAIGMFMGLSSFYSVLRR